MEQAGGGGRVAAAVGRGGDRDEKVEEQKCETFPVIKSCLVRVALLLLSTLSIINSATAFIHRCVNANTAATHTFTSCLRLFSTNKHTPGMYIRL